MCQGEWEAGVSPPQSAELVKTAAEGVGGGWSDAPNSLSPNFGPFHHFRIDLVLTVGVEPKQLQEDGSTETHPAVVVS